MTVEEAISVLERLAHTESKWPGTEDTLESLDMALSALRAQQEKPFGGWISVKDKLPEEDQGVILCTRETETYGKH